ncbi:peptidoglycan transpeptidase-transglycosylase PbpC [Psychroflexus torquis ATCC 700755]|uniref:peptidoglycan glycosyltransferase n=1 Tax=Psychroflexus torquis (strain ATCC 700755 / CIP 106069 / ACAM 623) TaxID=313595 RepID=K4ID06_PSYTT|nr:penicillin-binding protein 1C [Psychroflexus torquis]AFU67763.1 peptidoglycan transpeptidase-transglycosylase PbpC [Psychroflexus torquis ATCC 700755]
MKQLSKRKWLIGVLLFVVLVWWFSLPKVLFSDPISCVVNDQDGNLLGARIADDGQWRFPSAEEVPGKFEQAIVHFEDEYFYWHTGFNPISMAKAFYSNLTSSTKRGGSTLTQQVIRLSRKNKQRSYTEKIIELVQATRLELKLSKKEILLHYSAYAPFGGNVVGLEAASWRYFGISPQQLTWGQASALAVLPNSPSIIYPGKNDKQFLNKRNALLKKLVSKEVIDEETYQLSLLESLPSTPLPLPNQAFHFVDFVCQQDQEDVMASSIQYQLQQKANQITDKHQRALQKNNIYNLSLIVVENKTRKVLAYVGNTSTPKSPFRYVDMMQAKRSTGSTLKPFLYAAALEESQILPTSLLQDVPVSFNGYRPKNFNEKFHGLVPAHQALSRSLNVPFVNVLQDYGLPLFYENLRDAGLQQINKGVDHYGLTLILGGAEVSLWELTQAFVNFKDVYSTYVTSSSQYSTGEIQNLTINASGSSTKQELDYKPSNWHASSVYFTLKAMMELERPEDFNFGAILGNDQQIAWKTGTSYGFKDAWSIGMNKEYTVGVWVGNADTEGRPNLTGIKAAAPIMFDVFKELPKSQDWLLPPYDDVKQVNLCPFSGMPKSKACDESELLWIPSHSKALQQCTYHTEISVDETERYEVKNNCYPLSKMKKKSFVELSPIEKHFTQTMGFKTPPPLHPNCGEVTDEQELMEFIFPRKNERILLPKSFEGTNEEVVLQLAHSKNTEVHWYIDERYLTTTTELHETSIHLPPGRYQISVVDEKGHFLKQDVLVEKTL